MRTVEKIYPYLMIAIALIGLYINYKSYLDAKAEDDCDCQKTGSTGTGQALRTM